MISCGMTGAQVTSFEGYASLMRKAPFDPKELDFNEVVRETVEFLSAVAVGRKVELSSFLAPICAPNHRAIASNSSKSLPTWSSMRLTR